MLTCEMQLTLTLTLVALWIWPQTCRRVDRTRSQRVSESCHLLILLSHKVSLTVVCVCTASCSCGTFERTIRGPCRHLWVTPALCAAFTSRVVDWWVARRTTRSRCGTCHLNRAGRALPARWRWLDTATQYDAFRWMTFDSFRWMTFDPFSLDFLINSHGPVISLTCGTVMFSVTYVCVCLLFRF